MPELLNFINMKVPYSREELIMSERNYKAHVFICTKCSYKENGRECPKDTAADFRKRVKKLAKEHWDKTQVRINSSGCLDQCEHGIAAVVYPHNQWMLNLRPGDVQKLVDQIKELC